MGEHLSDRQQASGKTPEAVSDQYRKTDQESTALAEKVSQTSGRENEKNHTEDHKEKFGIKAVRHKTVSASKSIFLSNTAQK